MSQIKIFDDYELKANEKIDARIAQYSDENQLTRKWKKRVKPVLDMLCTELSQRLAYQEINSLFGLFINFTKSDDEIQETCEKFREHYSKDIEL